jgi:hypothetical protein
MSNQQKIENPTGAGKKQALRVVFDSRLKLEFHGSKVMSDAGLLAYRELDAALGLTDLGENLLSDWRTGKNTQHSMVALQRSDPCARKTRRAGKCLRWSWARIQMGNPRLVLLKFITDNLQ